MEYKMRKLKLLFIDAAVDISISDSARGYLNALRRAGHEVNHFNTCLRIIYHANALKAGPNPDWAENFALCSRLAAEGIVVEALRYNPDLVLVSSGLALHADGLELLNRVGRFPTAAILTESPYDDEAQLRFCRHIGTTFTNDWYSSQQYGWHYLASAYDPEFHHPYDVDPKEECDVLFIGTGWPERQKLLEEVDWTGIKLRLLGMWPNIKDNPDSPLAPYHTEVAVTNDETARLYGSAKITINHHRADPNAWSLNPRGYELGGVGAFQISDYRPEIDGVFEGSVPIYDGSWDLERIIRDALTVSATSLTPRQKGFYQREALRRGHHTFDDRVRQMMEVLYRAS